jgi:hypothetical protein
MYDGRTQGSPLHVLGTYVNEEFIFRAFLIESVKKFFDLLFIIRQESCQKKVERT